MIGAVAVLGYLLVKPFLDSPERARTLSDASPPTPTTVGDGSLADGAPPLSDAALRLDDLPEGWTALADATGPPVGFCEGRNPLLAITPRDELHTSFTKGPQGPFLSNLSLRFATVGEAEL
ncbi:MAG: hypothetical protein Q8K72_01205, partial [Acidimicrobiales bacterium]|nr:hypothetical protein [Acidimicrobiales bacterium]